MCLAQGLEEIIVKSKTDIYALLDRGSAKRRTAETLLNKQSSRSHSVFCVTVGPSLLSRSCMHLSYSKNG
jgi:kinesin family protein 11